MPEDVPLVEALLRARHPDASAPAAGRRRAAPGCGPAPATTSTAWSPGGASVLGGVDVPYDRGLAGHSDGDALTHAVTDALLGACALGDIGQHFPPGDPAYRDADSLGLLRTAVALAHAGRLAGPQPGRHGGLRAAPPGTIPARMAAALAAVLEVPPGNVNVKAKTNEGLDAVGRGRGGCRPGDNLDRRRRRRRCPAVAHRGRPRRGRAQVFRTLRDNQG